MDLQNPAAFDSFYSTKIEPELPRLRAECKSVDGWGYGIVAAGLLATATFIGYSMGKMEGSTAGWLIAFFIAGVIFSVYKYAQQNDRFTEDYKSAVVKVIMDEVCPGLVYKPADFISSKEYKSSSLFRHKFDYFDGGDYIEGKINGVPFHCCELHTQCDYSLRGTMTIFKGLFIVANINKRFGGGTYIWPKGGTQFSNILIDQYIDLMPMPKAARLHFDNDFEHYFHTSSTWPSQAEEILTERMRNKMIQLRRQLDTAISFSFVAGKCYIALPLSKDLLEPSNYDPGDKEEIRKYFLTLMVIPEIIKQLPLEELQ